MRYLAVLSVSVFAACLLAAAGFVLDPPAADAVEGRSVKKCGGGRISLNAAEGRTFVLHSRERAQRNLRPLCVHPRLQRAAKAHSADMLRRDYFSHNTKGRNENSCERVRRYNYRFRYCGENIAWGSGAKGSPENTMRNWMNSSAHRRNILSGRYREVGIGVARGTFRGYRNASVYTVDFGTRP